MAKSGTGSLVREPPSPTDPCTVALAPVPSVSPMVSVLCALVYSHKKLEFVSLFFSTHNKATSAPRRPRFAEQPHGSFVSVKTHTSSRSSGHYMRDDLLSTTIALSFNAQRVTHRTRTQFLHMSEHGPPNPQLFSTPITSPSAAAAGGAGGELRGPASLCHC